MVCLCAYLRMYGAHTAVEKQSMCMSVAVSVSVCFNTLSLSRSHRFTYCDSLLWAVVMVEYEKYSALGAYGAYVAQHSLR